MFLFLPIFSLSLNPSLCSFYTFLHGFSQWLSIKSNWRSTWNTIALVIAPALKGEDFSVSKLNGEKVDIKVSSLDMLGYLSCPDNSSDYQKIINWYAYYDQDEKDYSIRPIYEKESYPLGIYHLDKDPFFFVDQMRDLMCTIGYYKENGDDEKNSYMARMKNMLQKDFFLGFLNTKTKDETSLFKAFSKNSLKNKIDEIAYCGGQSCQYFSGNLSVKGMYFGKGAMSFMKGIEDGLNLMAQKGMNTHCPSNSFHTEGPRNLNLKGLKKEDLKKESSKKENLKKENPSSSPSVRSSNIQTISFIISLIAIACASFSSISILFLWKKTRDSFPLNTSSLISA